MNEIPPDSSVFNLNRASMIFIHLLFLNDHIRMSERGKTNNIAALKR